MAQAPVEANLLFGILAMQVGLIEQADLLDAFQRWSRDRSRPLAEVLVERGTLTVEDRLTLDNLVRRQVEKHGGSTLKGLASVAPTSTSALLINLSRMGDREIEATLADLANGDNGNATIHDAMTPDRGANATIHDPPTSDRGGHATVHDPFATGREDDPPGHDPLQTGHDGNLPANDPVADTEAGLPFEPLATAEGKSRLGQSTSAGVRFRLLRPHARGGIGIVSVAMDAELHREVALKEILPEQADNPVSRARFLLEAEVTGRLEHPGIVPVYGLGATSQGRPYYAMRFVRGESLKEAIEGSRESDASRGEEAMALRQLLSRFLDVCNTMAYAHSRGIIHRDIKPANIMLGPYGETLVVDWGLAKVVGREDDQVEPSLEATIRPSSASGSSETVAGTAMGTPAYMSPEQAEGRIASLGPASDVYSLGATLYSLLTGRPPFEEPDVIAVIRKVQRGDFPPPRQVDRRVPPALEAVVLKAMALQPADRYDSAAELGREVERWLADEPVRAYRDPTGDRILRWARNHKPAVTSMAVLVATAMAALAVNDTMIRAEKDRTEHQRRLAVDNFGKADQQRRLAERLSANLTIDRGLSFCERGEVNRGLLWLAHALEVTPSDEPALERTARASLAAWSRELTSLKAVLRHPREMVVGTAFRPGDGSILTMSKDSGKPLFDLTTWDLASSKPPVTPRQFGDPLGWIRDGNGVPGWFMYLYRDPFGGWLSPDGTTILVSDNETTAQLREITTGRPVGAPIPIPERLLCAAFSPDGTQVAIGGQDRTARVFVTAIGAPVGRPLTHQGWVTDVAFSPDGRTILTGSRDGTAQLWDGSTGRAILPPLKHQKDVMRVAYSPDGKSVLTGSFDNTARIWDATTGRAVGRPLAHNGVILALAFSPDGRTVLTGSHDGTARLWDAATSEPIGGPLRHQSFVNFVTFSPDGRAALTCSDDNSARLWDAATGLALGSPLEHLGTVYHAAFRPDGKLLVTAGSDFEAQVWDTSTSLSKGTTFSEGGPVYSVAYSPDGRTVAAGCSDGTARLRDAATGRSIGETLRHGDTVNTVAFDPAGRTVVTGSWDKTARLWDAITGKSVGDPMPHPAAVRCARFSPDGRSIITGDFEGTVRFWDAATGRPIGPTLSHTRGDRIESRRLQPRRPDRHHRERRHHRPALGRGDWPSDRRAAQASGLVPERGLPTRRESGRDRRLGQGGPLLGHGHGRARGPSADAPKSHLVRGL